MASYPVFVPMNTQHVVENCILVEGKKYCEDKTSTPKQAGVFILLFVLFFVWVLSPIFIHDKYNNFTYTRGFMWYVIPPLLLALLLIFS